MKERIVAFALQWLGAGVHCIACGIGLYIGVRLAAGVAGVVGG